MARKNPVSPLPADVFEESFSKGVLNTGEWEVSSSSYSSESNVDLQAGMLRLALNQAPTTLTPSAAMVVSTDSFSYGVFDFVFRASSTASSPTSHTGQAVSGSITYIQLYSDDTHLISVAIGASTTNNARNTIQLSTRDGGATSSASIAVKNPEEAFQSLKITWTSGKLTFHLNNKAVQTFTTNVPSAVMKIRLGHIGSNDTGIGGLGTASTPRYVYVSGVRYTPPSGRQFFSFEIKEQEDISFTLVPVVVNTPRDISFSVSETETYSVILSVTDPGIPVVTRDISFSVSETQAYTIALTTTPNPNITRDFAFSIIEQETIAMNLTRTGGGVALTTGWLNPTANASPGWTNPAAVYSSDDTRMTFTALTDDFTPEIMVYGFNGLSIPEGSTVNGIRVNVEGTTSGVVDTTYFRLVNVNTFTPKSAGEKTLALPGVTAGVPGDTGWVNAGAHSMAGWSNQVNSRVQDGAVATVTLSNADTPTAKWSGFNLSGVPATASIDGIEVRINGRSTATGSYSYFNIGNVVSGAPLSVNAYAFTLPVSPTTTAWVTKGGPTTLWGGLATGPISAADLTSSFGVMGAWRTTATNTYAIDGVQIKVYYTTAGTAGTEAVVTLGSTTDTWGNVDTNGDDVAERPWSYLDFNSDLAFWGQFQSGIAGGTFSIDHIQLNVSYTTPVVNDGGTGPVSTDTGWVAPTSQANDTGWTTPNNLFAEDGATADVAFTAGETPYLRVKGFTGLSTMPSDATIDGIEVKVHGRTTAAQDYSYLFVGDVSTGTPQAVTAQACVLPVHASTMSDVISGGPTNTWGGTPAAWTPAILQSADFGVSGAWGTTAANHAYLDSVFMKVYYTTAGSTGPTPITTIPLPSKLLATYLSPYSGLNTAGMVSLMATLVGQAYNQCYLFHAVPLDGDNATTGFIQLVPGFSSHLNAARVQALRSAGIRVVLAIGGQNWRMNFSNRQGSYNFTGDDPAHPGVVGANSIQSLYNLLGGLDGVDFNTFENTTFTASQYTELIYITTWLHTKYGTNFSVSCPPAWYNTTDKTMVGNWYAAANPLGRLDYVAPQVYDGGKPSDYPASHLQNCVIGWLPYVGNLATKVVLGTGSNYGSDATAPYAGATVAANLTAFTYLRANYPGFRGVFGWSTADDAAAGVPWSFINNLKTVT